MIMIPRRLTAATLAAIIACSAAFAQDSVPTSVPGASTAPAGPALTLQECITRALQKNFDLEVGRYNPQIARDSIETAKGAYQPQLSVTGATGKASSPGGSSRTSNVRVGVTQEL